MKSREVSKQIVTIKEIKRDDMIFASSRFMWITVILHNGNEKEFSWVRDMHPHRKRSFDKVWDEANPGQKVILMCENTEPQYIRIAK